MIILSTTLWIDINLFYKKKNSVMALPNSTVHGISYTLNCTKSYLIHKNVSMGLMPGGGGGGGGYFLMYAYCMGMCRARDPHFQPWISVPEHYHFHKFLPNPFRFITIFFLADFAVSETTIFKNPFRSITILHFWGGFCRSGDRHFPNAKRSAAPRVNSRPERQRQTRPGNSGE